MNVLVKRLSGQGDILPVTISERLINDKELKVGVNINAFGQFRSYNKLVDGKSKLMLTVFVRELLDTPIVQNPNSIVLSGYICKPPVYRTTPFNREIADLLIAVNRSYNKSDYIPCIAWGRNARFAKSLQVGEKIALCGRIQSREYQKRLNDEDVRIMTAYEVSISKLSADENAENFDIDKEFEQLGYSFNQSNQDNYYEQ
jgi:single-stranded DNA-binding protein